MGKTTAGPVRRRDKAERRLGDTSKSRSGGASTVNEAAFQTSIVRLDESAPLEAKAHLHPHSSVG